MVIYFSNLENSISLIKSTTLPISFLKGKPVVSPQIIVQYRCNLVKYNMKKSNIFCNLRLKCHVIVSWDFNKIRSKHLLKHEVKSRGTPIESSIEFTKKHSLEHRIDHHLLNLSSIISCSMINARILWTKKLY